VSKATETKLAGNHQDHREESLLDKRRIMKLVPSKPSARSRTGFSIGVSPNVFSKVDRSSAPDLPERGADGAPELEGEHYSSTPSMAVPMVIGGVLLAGVVGYLIGRRER
jgi:hypothetical protein